jgi:hypothetical protein
MKIIFLNPGHPKNVDALKRMCLKTNIELEITSDFARCQQNNYDILISNMSFFNPDLIPETIKIIFGPQLFVLPQGAIIGPLNSKWSSRSVNNTLSKWIERAFLEVASLVIPTVQFPFAVDTEKFKPSGKEKTLDCLIYFKHRSPETLTSIKQLIESKNLSYKILSYGSYQEQEYIDLLGQCKFVLSLDAHESQGFALEEAMSCNVPLLVYDINTVYDEVGTTIFNKYIPLELKATSVPYWSDECGLKTNEFHNIDLLLDKMINTYQTFNPRKYIVENLSEEKCMQRILDYFKL